MNSLPSWLTPGSTVAFHKLLSPSHAGCLWLKTRETVDIQKVFKNGNVAVALHDVFTLGADNRKTIHVPIHSLTQS